MYNTVTEEKIKNIPLIGEINIERLPQELTRIYAQIVSLRKQSIEGTINFIDKDLKSGLELIQKLSCNLETILLTIPNHEQKESIAFVAATANSLIYELTIGPNNAEPYLGVDTISPFIASIVLFLIGNSQPDAAEMAISLKFSNNLSPVEIKLVSCITSLAKGKLNSINDLEFAAIKTTAARDFQEIAIDLLWRELGLGIKEIAASLTTLSIAKDNNHFDRVVNLCISDQGIFGQKNVFAGPYRLAKLFKILEGDISKRGVITVPSPEGVDPIIWTLFLERLSKERPYLWENHKDAISTNFLNLGTSDVLTLPTGAGKSTLSELKIASCLYSGKNVIYLVPTHALEDQVNKNLEKLFDNYKHDNIVFDGEYSELPETEIAPILVMTPERCLTLINTNPVFIQHLGLVVFDEFHLVHGTDIKKDMRSIDAMYCLLSLFTLTPQSDYLLISAMVENGQDVCDWLMSVTRRSCILFNSSWKPTRQLHGCLVFEEKDVTLLNKRVQLQQSVATTKNPPLKLKSQMVIQPYCFFSLKNI